MAEDVGAGLDAAIVAKHPESSLDRLHRLAVELDHMVSPGHLPGGGKLCLHGLVHGNDSPPLVTPAFAEADKAMLEIHMRPCQLKDGPGTRARGHGQQDEQL